MSRRTQLIFLGVLFAILAVVIYFNYRSPSQPPVVSQASTKYQPLDIENPQLRMDRILRIRNFTYGGPYRNIFSAAPPPPPPPKVDPKRNGPQPPPPPPPLVVPAKFFGYAENPSSRRRRAFFATPDGEDIFIVGEGETLMNRFRLLRISNNTAEVEEIASGRRATLVLEEGSPPA